MSGRVSSLTGIALLLHNDFSSGAVYAKQHVEISPLWNESLKSGAM
jgi:hypothetical protein